MSTITVRQAVLTDLEALTGLFDAYRQFYGRASDTQAARTFLISRFEHGESVLFLALQDDEAIGFTQLYPSFSSLSLGRTFVLNDLFVHPNGRKKGIGTVLIRAATEYVKTVGGISMSLSTATTNASAQALYESLGWQRDEQFWTYGFAVAR